MSTEAQIAANRKNAQKSTGPKTPEGRDAVRHNGLKHGLTSEILVLPGESIADFEALLDSLQAEHQPATPTEVILVRQMAMASWRIQRLIHMEAAHFSLRRSELDVHFKGFYTDLREPDRQAIIADRDATNTLLNFSRYEARLERSFLKALTALQRLRALRKKEMTNQSQSQPAETRPDRGSGPARRAASHATPVNPPPATAIPHSPTVFS